MAVGTANKAHTIVQSRRIPKRPNVIPQALNVTYPDHMLYISMQIPLSPPQGRAFTGDINKQCEMCLNQISGLLKDAGYSPQETVQIKAFVTDIDAEKAILNLLPKFFIGGSIPTMSIMQVAGLPEGVAVAMEAVAIKPSQQTSK